MPNTVSLTGLSLGDGGKDRMRAVTASALLLDGLGGSEPPTIVPMGREDNVAWVGAGGIVYKK